MTYNETMECIRDIIRGVDASESKMVYPTRSKLNDLHAEAYREIQARVLEAASEEKASKVFLIGQRVIVHDEIGTVQRGPTLMHGPPPPHPSPGLVWVHLPSKGYASHFSVDNVQPLPGGQL